MIPSHMPVGGIPPAGPGKRAGLFTRLRGSIKRSLGGVIGKRFKTESARTSAGENSPHGDEGTALDKLIDGESITVADFDGGEAGYVMGWTSRKIPAELRPILWTQTGRLELETWREMLKDKTRAMPDELMLIFWEGLPLAVWIPAGRITSFDFSPN